MVLEHSRRLSVPTSDGGPRSPRVKHRTCALCRRLGGPRHRQWRAPGTRMLVVLEGVPSWKPGLRDEDLPFPTPHPGLEWSSAERCTRTFFQSWLYWGPLRSPSCLLSSLRFHLSRLKEYLSWTLARASLFKVRSASVLRGTSSSPLREPSSLDGASSCAKSLGPSSWSVKHGTGEGEFWSRGASVAVWFSVGVVVCSGVRYSLSSWCR